MTDRIVDTLARGMAAGGSRRALLAALGMAGVAAVAPVAPDAEAKKKCNGLCANKKKPSIYVRALHAAPFVGLVDVYVNEGLVAEDVPFGGSTPLLPVPVGPVRVQVTPAGTPVSEAVIDQTLNDLLACAGYEIAVANEHLVTRGLIGEGLEVFAYLLDTEKTANTATGRISAIHLSPNAPAVDVWDVSGPTAVPVFTNLEFGQQSEPADVPAGLYDLEVRVAGTDIVALAIPGLTVPGRESVQAHVIGLAGEDIAPAVELQALALSAPATCNLKTVG